MMSRAHGTGRVIWILGGYSLAFKIWSPVYRWLRLGLNGGLETTDYLQRTNPAGFLRPNDSHPAFI